MKSRLFQFIISVVSVLEDSFLPGFASTSFSQEQPIKKITYQEYILRVTQYYPEKEIDLLELERTKAMEGKTGNLPDPTLSIGRERTPFGSVLQPKSVRNQMENNNNGAAWTLTASQNLPWPGSLNAEKQVVKQNVELLSARIKTAHVLHIFEAKEIYLNLVTKSKQIEIERNNLHEAQRIFDSANGRFAHGLGSQVETLTAQSEKAILTANIDILVAEKENLSLLAKQRMGISLAQPVDFSLEWVQQESQNLSDLQRYPIELAAQVESARLKAERRSSLPEFMTSFMLMHDDLGMNMYGVVFGVRVPLYSGGIRDALSAEENLVAQKSQKEILWHEEKKNLALAMNSRKKISLEKNKSILLKELVPLAERRLSIETTEYINGKVSLPNLNESRKNLFKLKLTQLNIDSELAVVSLANERISAGFLDGEINTEIPSFLPVNMSDGAMEKNSMAGSMSKSESGKKMNSEKLFKSNESNEDSASDKSTNSMGM